MNDLRVTGFCALLLAATPALAQGERIRFWNLTAQTITHFYLAPAGTDKYGPDQCVNDRDGTVDHDEGCASRACRRGATTPSSRTRKAGLRRQEHRREGWRHLLDRGTASLELPEIARLEHAVFRRKHSLHS